MPRLAEIHDPETLQQVALHLEKTVVRQAKENAKLRAQIASLQGEDGSPQMELELLREQLAAMERKLYDASSEKRPTEQDTAKDKPKGKQRGHGPKSQPRLPIQEIQHVLAEEDRTCPVCGNRLEEMVGAYEESEEIDVVEVSYRLKRHKRRKYCCSCSEALITAPGPERLIPGGRYSVDFAVHVAEGKYLDHLPLERQVQMMGRRGLDVDSQTLWDQLDALADRLEPTYEALIQTVLTADVVYADETYWRVMGSTDETSRWWVWCVASDEAVGYRILKRRSAASAERLLRGYQGVVMTDGYTAYQVLERAGPDIVLAHCWAHVRRKFMEAEDAYPELSRYAVDRINALFEVERQVPRLTLDSLSSERSEVLELRRRLRAEQSRPVVDELFEWAVETRGSVLPRSKMGKAITYMLKLWPGLTRFLNDPRVPLDNNAAERALRGVVVGRKNHYGSRSKRGTEVAAQLYTLFESAKLSGVDPSAYVREATRRAIRRPGAVTLPNDII